MKDKETTKWAGLLRFLQWDQNTCENDVMSKTPHAATFSAHALLGLHSSTLPSDVITGLECEEDLVDACIDDNKPNQQQQRPQQQPPQQQQQQQQQQQDT